MVQITDTVNVIKSASNNNTREAVTSMIKYTANQALEEIPDTFVSNVKSAGTSSLVFGGIPLFNYLSAAKKTRHCFITNGMKQIGSYNKEALNKLLKGEGKLKERILNYFSTVKKTQDAYMAERSSVKALNKAEKILKKIDKNPGKAISEKKLAKLDKFMEKAKLGAGESQNILLSIGKNTGKSAGKLSIPGKFRKMLKSSGAGFMLVASGISEFFSEIYPTFKELGMKKGFKQIGKSAIKVAGDTFGFIAGQSVCTAIGTAIGTAICPGIGTAIGSLCGFAGGMLGSFLMGKVTKSITGPTEREIAKKAQNEIQADEILKNEEELNKLKSEVLNKIQADMADDGKLTKDSLLAQKAVDILEQSAPSAA